MPRKTILTVDCGASHAACGRFVRRADGRWEAAAVGVERFVAPPGDQARWLELTEQAVRTLLGKLRCGGPALVAVPGHMVLVKFVRTPAVAAAKREDVARFEAAQNIPHPLDEVAWSSTEVADDGTELELMLVAARTEAMEALCAGLERAGLAVREAEPGCVALWRAWRLNYADAAQPDLIVDVGAQSTHLLFAGKERHYFRTLMLGGNAVTQAVAEVLGVGFAQAEAVKLRVSQGRDASAAERSAVGRAATEFLERLQMEVTRSRLGYARQSGSVQPGRVLLAGGGAQLPGAGESLAQALGLPVEKYDAWRGLPPADKVHRDGIAAAERDDVPAIPLGLAAAGVGDGATRISLLPPQRRAARSFERRSRRWLAAAGLLILALLPPLAVTHMQHTQAVAQLRKLDRELKPLRAYQRENDAGLRRLDELTARNKELRGLVQSRGHWVEFFSALQEQLGQVGDVWFDRLQLPLAASGGGPAPAGPVELRMQLQGRMLTGGSDATTADAAQARIKALLGRLEHVPFVRAVKDVRYDERVPGLLNFDVTLVLNPGQPL